MSSHRIALANIRPATSPEDSVTRVVNAIARAAADQVRFICFPECYVPGYRFAQSSLPPPDAGFLGQAWNSIATVARKNNVGVVLGTERVIDGKVRATVLVIQPNGVLAGFQDKVQLDPSEDPTYAPGTERRVFEDYSFTFGVAICHEGWRYPETVRWAVQHGARVVFHPHFHVPEPGGFRPATFLDPRNTFHEKAMLCRAAENTCWFASVNCAIEGSPTTSAVIRPDGTVLAWHPYGVEGLLVADLDLSLATGLLAKRCR